LAILLFGSIVAATSASTTGVQQAISGSDGATIAFSLSDAELAIEYQAPDLNDQCAVYVALGTHSEIGSAVVPFQQAHEGSTVFLPFKADLFFYCRAGAPPADSSASASSFKSKWERWKWSKLGQTDINAKIDNHGLKLRIPRSELGDAKMIDCAVYAKDLSQNDGWGRLFGCSDSATGSGTGDKYVSHYLELNLGGRDPAAAGGRPARETPVRLGPSASYQITSRARLGGTKLRIYQLFVRLFGNTNETRKEDGTLAENGVGKFNDINDAALESLHPLGFTHIWLTGVLRQATATDYSSIGLGADDPDLLKGLAGSPYAIKDYFDVCPDYAVNPTKRLDEFKALLERIHKHNMKALIDFVPNHVARSYNCQAKPDLNFGTKGNDGAGDDTSVFFSPKNNFFYLQPDQNGPPLHLPTVKDGAPVSPTCKVLANIGGTGSVPSLGETGRHGGRASICDGLFDGETKFGRVTGNNKATWAPDINDWYETVKLNYGFDFTKPDKSVRDYPNANTPDKAIPDTWIKMDRVIAHWQSLGVDGFRCDMSHMVPPEFWNWAIAQARARRADVIFIGEAYDNDPAKVPGVDPVISKLNGGKSNVMFDLLDAGFNGVYDDPTYRAIKKIYEGPGWANDIDDARPNDFIFDNSLRYAENHDEVRLAAKSQWGAVGKQAGPAICAILYGLSRGPIMLYNGQEVGEPGDGIEGFGSNDARTSIFDYWSMPEMTKWVNGHKYDGGRLSNEQKQLRDVYGRLINLLNEPAFRDGDFLPLNPLNRDNPKFGRLPSEQPSGHWLYAFLRTDSQTGQKFIVVVNLNPTATLSDVRVQLPASTFGGLATASPSKGGQDRQSPLRVTDRLNSKPLVDLTTTVGFAQDSGIPIAELPPMTACYLEIKHD
jgi:glycosidase